MVTSQKNGVLDHTALKTSTRDVNVITNGYFRCSSVRIVTENAGWKIEEPGFDAGQTQQVIITSQLPPGPYWNLKPSYVVVNRGFPAGDIETAA
jgi:hypothetical protein